VSNNQTDIDFSNDFFKFKSIKTYCNTEWLYNNTKNYRTVFEKEELAYVYCELAIYNKKFDLVDWDMKLDLLCYDEFNEQICVLNCDRIIKKEDPIAYIREGWGVVSKGTYWGKGIYRWEAQVEGKTIALQTFYVENQHYFSKHINPYFSIIQAKLYEGPDENVSYNERNFTKTFDVRTVRYVWIEIEFLNKLNSKELWNGELFFYYKSSAGLLKGFCTRFFNVNLDLNHFYIDIGWGSDDLGTWNTGYYSIEVVFMNTLIATIPFEIYNKKTLTKTLTKSLTNYFKLKNKIKL